MRTEKRAIMELAKREKRRGNGGEEGSSHEASLRWSSLPPELMTEILLRLPTRSVGRFRCVSKPFRSLLSDPEFAKNHLDLILRNDAVRHRRLILYLDSLFSVDFDRIGDDDGCEGIRELDLDLLCKMEDETGKYKRWGGSDVTIVGSANGLVCTCTYFATAFVFLYNPTTGESKQVPELPESLRTKHSDEHRVDMHGFAFDALADDYKVVKFVFSVGSLTAYVYYLKLDSWRQICHVRYRLIYPTTSGVYLNGALHWIAYLGEGLNNRVVAAFDVKREEFREMSLPDEANSSKLEVGILNGCLCVAYNSYPLMPQHDIIWVMNEYGLESSWSKIQLSVSYNYLKPLCSTNNDGEVLLVIDEQLVLYNFDYNTSTNLEIDGINFGVKWLEASIYVESLISPNSYGVES